MRLQLIAMMGGVVAALPGNAVAQHMNASDSPCLYAGSEMGFCLSQALNGHEDDLSALLERIGPLLENDERSLFDEPRSPGEHIGPYLATPNMRSTAAAAPVPSPSSHVRKL